MIFVLYILQIYYARLTMRSFPNSGTSFTSLLIRHASNATTATNYGMESKIGPDGKSSVPVYDYSEEGPYWLYPPPAEKIGHDADDATYVGGDKRGSTKLDKSRSYGIPPTSASILTKTHCGSRCAFCPPRRYLETPESFLRHCLSGSRKVKVQTDEKVSKKSLPRYEKRYSTYHPSLVEKAIHLIRNPFDNLVSRFHHEQKEHKKKNSVEWTRRYSNDVIGFRKWCADEDAIYAAEERSVDWSKYGYPKGIIKRFEGVSCHGELFRYVQWHVMAARAVDMLDIPVLYVYYEDYSTDLKASTIEMLDFLNLKLAGELPYFDSNKDYSAYFTQEERATASDFMRRVASERGRELLERYWVELDFGKLRSQTKSIK